MTKMIKSMATCFFILYNLNKVKIMRFKSKIKISHWLEEQGLKKEEFHIYDSLAVEVFKTFNLKKLDFATLPVNFYKINGDFNCHNHQFKNFKGFPKLIEGSLIINNHQQALKNYDDFPKSISNMLIIDFFDIAAFEKIIQVENLKDVHLIGRQTLSQFNQFFNRPEEEDIFKSFSIKELQDLIHPYIEKKQLDKTIGTNNRIIKKLKL